MTAAILVRAFDLQAEWQRQPGAAQCESVDPDPAVPDYPLNCSRPYDHLGTVHAATVPDPELGVDLIVAVWTE